MLDIKRIRQEPEKIKDRLQTRKVEAHDLIESLLGCDEKRRLIETEKQSLQGERNAKSKEIGERKKAGEDTTEVESSVPDHAILATNTSSLSIARISSSLRSPSRFVGMHFFNPVHIMALVEVVWGPQTSDATLEAVVQFARRLGKEPIVVRDAPGFASSRLGIVLGMEAIRMVEQGVASPEDIDKAMELGYRHPMGPLKLTDLVGLDVRLGIAEYLHEALGSDAFTPPNLLRRMVAEGKLGKKSGEGFYSW